ncbi:MAG: GNAT family N-acetyltransferase [Acidimicrobiia bacterium]|jgi:ribosomal protein S18 acetylase RimI-like enzyme
MSNDRLEVREARDADADAFATFFRLAWQEAGPESPGFTGADETTIAELTTPDAFRLRLAGPDRHLFLAWDDDRVVGFAATRRIDPDRMELSGIIVLESRTGQGVGTALVDSAISAARALGYDEMIVKTETDNHRARSFYESRGFALSGVETEHVDDLAVEVWRLVRPVRS